MAKPKKKEAALEKSDRTARAGESTPVAESAEEFLELWRSELQSIELARIESVPVLIAEISRRVCLRMGEADNEELSEFLIMMLETDPEICEELEAMLKQSR